MRHFRDYILYLYTGDVFTAGNNNVFQPVYNFNIAIGMNYSAISTMEPPASKSILSLGIFFKIPLHNIVTTHNDLTTCFAVPGQILHVVVDHPDWSILDIGNTLMCLQ